MQFLTTILFDLVMGVFWGTWFFPTSRKKCMRPDLSPTITVCPSGATAQLCIPLSLVKAAISSPFSKSQSRSVPSCEPEMARCHGYGFDRLRMAFELAQFLAPLQAPES